MKHDVTFAKVGQKGMTYVIQQTGVGGIIGDATVVATGGSGAGCPPTCNKASHQTKYEREVTILSFRR